MYESDEDTDVLSDTMKIGESYRPTTFFPNDWLSDSETELPPCVVLPDEPTLKRRRARHPESHKKEIMKKVRLSGVAHIGAKGQAVSDRTVQSKDCSKCLRKCSSYFSGLLHEQINK